MSAQTRPLGLRILLFGFGLIAYLLFFVTITYAIGFVGNLVVPKSVNTGAVESAGRSVLINAALLSLFVIQHTIMARPWFKRRWTTIVPQEIERSIFVMCTSLLLLFIFWQWRPIPEVVWQVDHAFGRAALYGLFGLGWLLVFYSSFCIDHFDLFGLRQVVLCLRGREYTHPGFAMPVLYRIVRNPLMLGFLMAFWSTPVMTRGHLLFAALTTAYIFMGIHFEERDLMKTLGDEYRRYRAQTPMILPIPRRQGWAGRRTGDQDDRAQTSTA